MNSMDRNQLIQMGKKKLMEYQAKSKTKAHNDSHAPPISYSQIDQNTSHHSLLQLLRDISKEKAELESDLLHSQKSLQDYKESYNELKREMEWTCSQGKHEMQDLQNQLKSALSRNDQLLQEAMQREQILSQLELEKTLLMSNAPTKMVKTTLDLQVQQVEHSTHVLNDVKDDPKDDFKAEQEATNVKLCQEQVIQSQQLLNTLQDERDSLMIQVNELTSQLNECHLSMKSLQNQPIQEEEEEKEEIVETNSLKEIQELKELLIKKDSILHQLQKELSETHQNTTNQLVLLGNTNANLKRELEAEKKLVDLLSAEVDTLPDYIELFHKERKLMQEKYQSLLNSTHSESTPIYPILTPMESNIIKTSVIHESPLAQEHSKEVEQSIETKESIIIPSEESESPVAEYIKENSHKSSSLRVESPISSIEHSPILQPTLAISTISNQDQGIDTALTDSLTASLTDKVDDKLVELHEMESIIDLQDSLVHEFLNKSHMDNDGNVPITATICFHCQYYQEQLI